jgi:hypothetical protein
VANHDGAVLSSFIQKTKKMEPFPVKDRLCGFDNDDCFATGEPCLKKKYIYINTREREARQQQGFPSKCLVTGCAWRLIALFKDVTDAMLVPLPLFKYAVVGRNQPDLLRRIYA